MRLYSIASPIIIIPANASSNKCKKTHQNMLFDDGAVTRVGLVKKKVDGYELIIDDIYGRVIP